VIAGTRRGKVLCKSRQFLFLAAAVLAFTAHSARAQVNPVEARIASVTGTAILSSGEQSPTPAKRGDVLIPGEEIDTRAGGHLTIELTDGSLVVVRPGSRVVLKDFRAASTLRELFEVLLGRVRIKINHFSGKPNPYRINSPTASIAVRGTDFSVAVNGVGDTEVIVYEGLVEVTSLSNPNDQVLVHPGQGVIVRPSQSIEFFVATPGGEIGGLGQGQESGNENEGRELEKGTDHQDLENSNSPRNSAGIYDHFVENVVQARQSPLFLRFTAYPDSALDALENPAYATEFSAPEARVFLVPSFRGNQGVLASQTDLLPSPGQTIDYSLSPQGSFFMPLPDHRTVIGGGVAVYSTGLQSSTLSTAAEAAGTRVSSDSAKTSFLSSSFSAGYALGKDKRSTLGLGLEYVRGWGSLVNFATQQDAAGTLTSERINSSSNLAQTRIKAGFAHDFSGQRKLGIYYSYGFISADFGNVSHTVDGQPQSLDTTHTSGRASEVRMRFRGVLTRKLFYGVEASAFFLSLDDRVNIAAIANSHEHERTAGSSVAVGIGYALRPRIVFTMDLAGGLSYTDKMRREDATGNLLQRTHTSIPFLSAHEAIQADVWKRMFVSGSLLTVRQTRSLDLTLYPDRLGRLLTSDGTFAPNGVTRNRATSFYSEFGAGWRFSDNFLAEYVFATNYGLTPPSHIFLLRYSFRPFKVNAE
jgi:hypothetical protein